MPSRMSLSARTLTVSNSTPTRFNTSTTRAEKPHCGNAAVPFMNSTLSCVLSVSSIRCRSASGRSSFAMKSIVDEEDGGGHRPLRAALAASLFFISGCGSGPLIEIVSTWPKDQVAILLLTGSDGNPLGPGPTILDGDVSKFELDTKEPIRAHVLSYPQLVAGGPDFERCGIAIRGAGSPLPRPEHYFASASI